MQKEIIIKYSKFPKSLEYIIITFLIAVGIGDIVNHKTWSSLLPFLLAAFFYFIVKWERKTYPPKKIIMKISETRLWTRAGNKTWDSIIVIKFRFQNRDHIYMDIYRSNDIVADEEISLWNINYSAWCLKRILRRYVKIENH